MRATVGAGAERRGRKLGEEEEEDGHRDRAKYTSKTINVTAPTPDAQTGNVSFIALLFLTAECYSRAVHLLHVLALIRFSVEERPLR